MTVTGPLQKPLGSAARVVGGVTGSYLDVLRTGQARKLALGGIVGRFREGGTSLGIVLAVRATGGSFALAGAAAAVFLFGAAISRPAQGRWIDRTTPRRALILATSANALTLLGLAAAVSLGSAVGLLIAISGLVGLSLPAFSAVLRALWPTVAPAAVEHAYALDTLLYELSLIAAPALVGLLVALASPSVALIALAALGSAGILIVASTSAARPVRQPEVKRERRTRPTSRAFAALVVITLCVGFAEGSLTVIVPAFASGHHTPGISGPLLSALAAGSLAGAVAYGAVVGPVTWRQRLVGCAALLTAGFVLLASFAHSVVLLALLLAAVGVALSPTLTSVFIAIERTARSAALTEAFAWTSFSAPAGAAGGQALAGLLIAGPGLSIALWQPAIAAGAALTVSMLAVRLAPGQPASG